jgi:hypothetical protein
VLYFFSADCTQRKRVETARKELSREFTMQGLLCGKDDPGPCRSTNDDLQYTVRKEIILE